MTKKTVSSTQIRLLHWPNSSYKDVVHRRRSIEPSRSQTSKLEHSTSCQSTWRRRATSETQRFKSSWSEVFRGLYLLRIRTITRYSLKGPNPSSLWWQSRTNRQRSLVRPQKAMRTIQSPARFSWPKWCKHFSGSTKTLPFRKHTATASSCSRSTTTTRMTKPSESSSPSHIRSFYPSSLVAAHQRQASTRSSSRASSSNAHALVGHWWKSFLDASCKSLRKRSRKTKRVKRMRKSRRRRSQRKLRRKRSKARGRTTRDSKRLSFTLLSSKQVKTTRKAWSFWGRISDSCRRSSSKSYKQQRLGNKRKWRRLVSVLASSSKLRKQSYRTRVAQVTNSNRQSSITVRSWARNSQ